MEGDYRNKERVEAFKRQSEKPSAENQAVFDEEIRLNAEHKANRRLTIFIALILADFFIALYCFRRRSNELRVAND